MRGSEFVAIRKRLGFSQKRLMDELGIKSRQTISSWEKADREVPRIAELALIALEHVPACRLMVGSEATARERREFSLRNKRGGPQ